MEKTSDAVVLPLDAGWSDVGSWAALHGACEADARGNVSRGDVIAEESNGCYLYSESRLVAVVGLENHVVIETKGRRAGCPPGPGAGREEARVPAQRAGAV